jgi:hypothetical protein
VKDIDHYKRDYKKFLVDLENSPASDKSINRQKIQIRQRIKFQKHRSEKFISMVVV